MSKFAELSLWSIVFDHVKFMFKVITLLKTIFLCQLTAQPSGLPPLDPRKKVGLVTI